MERLLQIAREYPAVAGVSFFLLTSLLLALFFGSLLLRAGGSLKPLVFFFGFLAIVGAPQAIVHLMDAYTKSQKAQSGHQAETLDSAASITPATESAPNDLRQPVPWSLVFGPNSDPALIINAKLGLDAILRSAIEAKLSFNSNGESALAARFATAEDALQALNAYGAFFEMANAIGSDEDGWTAQRFNGQGEWTHVAAIQNELYAWSGSTRESVVANRTRALGPIVAANAPPPSNARFGLVPSTRTTSARLEQNAPVMAAFLVINLAFAVGWFFKGSAWSARVVPSDSVPALVGLDLRDRLLSLNSLSSPVVVTRGEGCSLNIEWRYDDARLSYMSLHGIRRAHKLILEFDEESRKVRVSEYWSAIDGSIGPQGIRFDWKAATGIQLFSYERKQMSGAKLDEPQRLNSAGRATYTFDLQSMKRPAIEAVINSGWTWQPVVWNAPKCLRWLTE